MEDLKAENQITENTEAPKPAQSKRDVNVSTLVHLMGIPTSQDLTVLESKVDVIASKIASMGAKVERMSKQFTESSQDSYLERIDYQVAELRGMLKAVLPQLASLKTEDVKEPAKAEKSKVTKKAEERKETEIVVAEENEKEAKEAVDESTESVEEVAENSSASS